MNQEGLTIFQSPPEPSMPYPQLPLFSDPFAVLYKRYTDALANMRKIAELITYAKMRMLNIREPSLKQLAFYNVRTLEDRYLEYEFEANEAATELLQVLQEAIRNGLS